MAMHTFANRPYNLVLQGCDTTGKRITYNRGNSCSSKCSEVQQAYDDALSREAAFSSTTRRMSDGGEQKKKKKKKKKKKQKNIPH